MTAAQIAKAILEDREATAEDEGRIRNNAQTELALKWKAEHDAKKVRTA